MNIYQIWTVVVIVGLTLLSGLGDSRGFYHAARIWNKDRLDWMELVFSSLGFTFGIIMYWIVIRYLQKFGIVSAEMQTLGWFAVTIVGVALISGRFLQWHWIDKVIALVILAGIGWLLFRTSG